MTHIWKIIDENTDFSIKNEMQIWALNEMTTVAILSLEPSLNSIWGNKFENYLQNYPILKEPKEKIKALYQNKKNFSDYMEDSAKIVESLAI